MPAGVHTAQPCAARNDGRLHAAREQRPAPAAISAQSVSISSSSSERPSPRLRAARGLHRPHAGLAVRQSGARQFGSYAVITPPPARIRRSAAPPCARLSREQQRTEAQHLRAPRAVPLSTSSAQLRIGAGTAVKLKSRSPLPESCTKASDVAVSAEKSRFEAFYAVLLERLLQKRRTYRAPPCR